MANYLQNSRILLISSHTSHRSGLRKTMVDMGVNNKSILVASDYNQAKDLLDKEPINVVVSDEDIGKGHHAIDLIELHRKNNPVRIDRYFLIMMDSEVTPFVLADFTLRGGDMALSKPFKNASFIQILQTLIETKGKLTADEKSMLTIEDLIVGGDVAKAQEQLKTIKNHESVQYCYSQGLVAEAEGNMENAYEHFLKSNKIKPGFKSLVPLVRVGAKLKKYAEMKQFVEVWLYEFPIHHSSLSDITRVIIANEKYDLLDQMFKIFSTHNVTDTIARIPLAAGFVMVSTDCIQKGEKEKAKEYALKGIEYANKRLPILLKAIENMVKAGDADGAEKAYLKNSPELAGVDDQILDLRIRGSLYPKSKVLPECIKLIDQKVLHADLFSFTIACMKELGKDPGDIIAQAKRNFPKVEFN